MGRVSLQLAPVDHIDQLPAVLNYIGVINYASVIIFSNHLYFGVEMRKILFDFSQEARGYAREMY